MVTADGRKTRNYYELNLPAKRNELVLCWINEHFAETTASQSFCSKYMLTGVYFTVWFQQLNISKSSYFMYFERKNLISVKVHDFI